MCNTDEILKNSVIAIFAGRGNLPVQIIAECKAKNYPYIIIAFKGQTPKEILKNEKHQWVRFGSVAKLFKILHAHKVTHILMAGAMTRPSFLEIRPDMKALSLGVKTLLLKGDDGLLQACIKILEEQEGFKVISPSDVVDLTTKNKLYTTVAPTLENWKDINIGFKVANTMGSLDIGQGCIIQQEIVLSVEALEGTKNMIERTKTLKLMKKGMGGVLVKILKPQQDTRVDMPTIGENTINQAHKAGCQGIALQAHKTLLIDEQSIIKTANKHKMFLIGTTTEDIQNHLKEI